MLEWRRLDSNIESKSSNNTYLNIIKIFNKWLKKLNIIILWNLVVTSTNLYKPNLNFEKIATQTRTIRRGVWNLPNKFHLYLIYLNILMMLNKRLIGWFWVDVITKARMKVSNSKCQIICQNFWNKLRANL